jgi:hypothetical protein
VLAGVIAASLAAIAVGLAMGGRYPGPEPGTPAANDPEHVLVLCGVVVLGWFVIALITPFAYLFNVVTLGGLLLPFILLERVYLALWPPPVPTDPGPAWDPDPAHHYAALEADPRSSERLLRDAYRRQALRHHPDLGGDLETMQRLNTAWEVLGDPARRREYDRLAAPPRGAGAG